MTEITPLRPTVPPSSTVFPSDDDRKRLQALKLSAMSDDDRWRWHSYDYGWRRVMQSDFGKASPLDPKGEWFNALGAAKAESFFRLKFKRPVKPPIPAPSHADAVRTDWAKIPRPELTAAEAELSDQRREGLIERAKAAIAAAEKRWREAFRGPRRWRGTEVQEAKRGYDLAKMTPDRQAYLNSLLDKQSDPL